ncbi:spore cortex biosynthesis protein YabQ [Cohnella caldifontis]|uniref:spore cortex biosynthesis protein YabQ n=1 Tax=Cohnella caldifontis TaxID=3027471 RepID=UPI0023EB336A|nr:spore cortex biosynthesis protein YabQ [Cohnella sp. YIM B05605]
MNAAAQWSTIGWMVACGLAMGLVFDLYRVVSHKFRIPRWLLPALDLIYWAAATVVVFRVLLGHNHGEVRLYVFLGLGIGVTGYFGLFSPRVLKIFARLLDAGARLAAWIWKTFRIVIVAPVMMLVRLLAKLLDILFLVTAAILLWTGRLLLIPLRPVGRYMWEKLLPARKKARSWLDAAKRWRDKLKAAWDLFRKK